MRKHEQETGGVLIFDDTVEEKPFTDENDTVCWHYSHNRLLSIFAWFGKIRDFQMNLLQNFESICKHMVEKFGRKCTGKINFNKQMEFRKKSNKGKPDGV